MWKPFERVGYTDTLQAESSESSLSELSFENKGFRSRGAHRASPCRERFLRYTPAKTAFFYVSGDFLSDNSPNFRISFLRGDREKASERTNFRHNVIKPNMPFCVLSFFYIPFFVNNFRIFLPPAAVCAILIFTVRCKKWKNRL